MTVDPSPERTEPYVPRVFVGTRELAARIGLSPRTIRTKVVDPLDPLPAHRVGGKLLFRWIEVERWIRRHRVHPAELESSLADRADQVIKEFK